MELAIHASETVRVGVAAVCGQSFLARLAEGRLHSLLAKTLKGEPATTKLAGIGTRSGRLSTLFAKKHRHRCVHLLWVLAIPGRRARCRSACCNVDVFFYDLSFGVWKIKR